MTAFEVHIIPILLAVIAASGIMTIILLGVILHVITRSDSELVEYTWPDGSKHVSKQRPRFRIEKREYT